MSHAQHFTNNIGTWIIKQITHFHVVSQKCRCRSARIYVSLKVWDEGSVCSIQLTWTYNCPNSYMNATLTRNPTNNTNVVRNLRNANCNVSCFGGATTSVVSSLIGPLPNSDVELSPCMLAPGCRTGVCIALFLARVCGVPCCWVLLSSHDDEVSVWWSGVVLESSSVSNGGPELDNTCFGCFTTSWFSVTIRPHSVQVIITDLSPNIYEWQDTFAIVLLYLSAIWHKLTSLYELSCALCSDEFRKWGFNVTCWVCNIFV